MQGSGRDAQRSTKRYVTPINKWMHCILICFTWLLVHMFLSEYVYVVVFIHKKDSKRRLCEVSARICTRYAQRHQLAKAISQALACEVVAAKTSATHTHIRALIYVNNMVTLLHRHRRHCVHAIRAKNKSEHICKSSRPCSNMHRAINKSAKPLADMCIICVCELLPVHQSNRIVM